MDTVGWGWGSQCNSQRNMVEHGGSTGHGGTYLSDLNRTCENNPNTKLLDNVAQTRVMVFLCCLM